MENELYNKMENEAETGAILWCVQVGALHPSVPLEVVHTMY